MLKRNTTPEQKLFPAGVTLQIMVVGQFHLNWLR
jgi:hypothetical protein